MMIYPMPYPIFIESSSTSEMTITQLLLVVGVGIVISMIICFFIEHDISDIMDWFKEKFRKEKK